MIKDDLKSKLIEVVEKGLFHANYKRTVDLAELYSQLISGKDINCLLKQFVRREDDEMFKQRVILTQETVPSTCSTVIRTFNKVFRTDPIVEVIDFEGADVQNKIDEMKEVMSKIYGGKSIYKYFQDRFLYLSFTDPNAFVYTTINEFDEKKEKPKPFNIEIPSFQAINYEYINNILQWLVTRSSIQYLQNNTLTNGFIYTIYGVEWGMVLTQVGNDYKVQQGEELIILKPDLNDVSKDLYFLYTEYNHKSEVIPVIQVGYERDLYTDGQTFVSPIEAGVPYLMKLVKAISEFDLTMCLHAFPQKFQYLDPCQFKPDQRCHSSGKIQSECDICGKTGFRAHTSAQDAQFFKMPKDPQDMINLSEIVHYEQPPIDILEFQNKIIGEWETKFIKSVFNSERFTKDEVAKTATGENVDMQNVYDTLKPFAEKISDVWVHTAAVSSYYMDFKNPITQHSYPDDFKLKTTEQLLDEISKAQNVSGHIIESIETDIMKQRFIDNPTEFHKYEIKLKFFPFKGKTRDEIATIINSGQVREDDIILYNYFDLIFSEIEEELLSKDDKVWFYDMATAKQRDLIKKKVAEIKAQIQSQNAIVLPIPD